MFPLHMLLDVISASSGRYSLVAVPTEPGWDGVGTVAVAGQ